MTRKIIGGIKDENGAYQPLPKKEVPSTDVSIDGLLNAGLQAIKQTMKSIHDELNLGSPSRETVMNLKDVMAMLRDLKKDEKDILADISDEQLEKMMKK